jgi:hypothetical protein
MSDKTIIEAAARALGETEDLLDVRCGDDEDAQKIVHAILAAVAPLIRAAALEEAAAAAETRDLGDHSAQDVLAQEIAVAIRALAGHPADPT